MRAGWLPSKSWNVQSTIPRTFEGKTEYVTEEI